ncbi:MAG: M23 family metallopeptidase [Oscillospiraceae bacterium]|nr:M23 family metallopeptidase [Oscillospiraceae bacterium]
METTYRTGEKRRQTAGRRTGGRPENRHRRQDKALLGRREKRRLAQLCVCLVLFFGVFFGKGVFPEQMEVLRARMVQVLHADTDYKAVFSNLGYAISSGEPVADTMQQLWVEVFSPSGMTATEVSAHVFSPEMDFAVYEDRTASLFDAESTQTLAQVLGLPDAAEEVTTVQAAEETTVQAPAETPAETAAPSATPEPEVIHMDYSGEPLPDNAPMDKYSLGLSDTVTPAMGVVSSGFGWRIHPGDGEDKFHNGVDIAVDTGTAIGAFADGTVDYIGDSPVYGLYLQLDHGNGIKTFYAHCSKLCVQKGQIVSKGEKVAEAGETGNATGPHLHFEIKRDGVLLNPIYYIESN